MARLPAGICFVVQSKAQNQQKWQLDDQFDVDPENGVDEGSAQAQAQAAFDALYGAHQGGSVREYRMLRCEKYGYEVRPVGA
jgi:hypothetical protein